MPPRARGIALPTFPQCVVLLLAGAGCWLGWGEFAAFRERQGLWNPTATATERLRAADAYSEQGEEGVPELIRALDDPHHQTRRYAALVLARLETRGREAIPQLHEHLRDPHPVVRGQVATTLAVVDPDSVVSMEKVAALLADPNRQVRQEAAAALRSWGPQAESTIVSQLRHQSPVVREIAIDLAPRTSEMWRAVLPVIRELTFDSSKSVREAAIFSIIDSGAATVPELVEWLSVDSEKVSAAAVSALRRFGPEAAVAVPRLTHYLKHSQLRNRLLAVETLRAIGSAAGDAVPALLACCAGAGDWTMLTLLQAIESIGADARILVGPLEAFAEHRNPAVAGTALRMLHQYDPERARDRVHRLISALGGSDPSQVRTACSTIVHLGVLAEAALPNLQLQLKVGDRQTRHFALVAIRSLGPAGAPAVPLIVSLLNDSESDPGLIDELVEAVIAIGAAAHPAADAILARLFHERSHAQFHRQGRLIVAAARIGVATPEFREMLRDFLESGRPVFQIAALEALGILGASDDTDGQLILDSLDAYDPAIRLAAIHAVPAALGAERAADVLKDCLTDSEPRIRVAAAQALARMGGSAGTALPALRIAAHDLINNGPANSFLPMSYGPRHPPIEAYRFEVHREGYLPASATVSEVMEQAIRQIESPSPSFAQ